MNMTQDKKKIYIVACAIIGCLLLATSLYAVLRQVKNTSIEPQSTQQDDQPAASSSEEKIKDADAFYDAADKALRVGDVEEGLDNLQKAQALYEGTDEVIKLEQTKDQIAAAKQALEAKKRYEAAQPKGATDQDRSKEVAAPDEREMDKTNQ